MKIIICITICMILFCEIGFTQDKPKPAKMDTVAWANKANFSNFIQSEFRKLNDRQIQLDGKFKELNAEQKDLDARRNYFIGQMDLMEIMADSILVKKNKE